MSDTSIRPYDDENHTHDEQSQQPEPVEASGELLDRLADDQRITRAGARMLTVDQPPVQADVDDAVSVIRKWMDETGTTTASLAKQLGKGFTAPTISGVLNGSYKGNCARVVNGILSLIEQARRRAEVAGSDRLVYTTIVQRMMRLIEQVNTLQRMGVIIGQAGCGKTRVLEAAHEKYAGSLLVRVNQLTCSKTSFSRSIAKELVGDFTGNSWEAWCVCLDHLRGSGRLLLIDETQRLNRDAVEVIRDIHDATRIPIVMAGTDALGMRIDDTAFGAQMVSRVQSRYNANTDIIKASGGGGRTAPAFTVADILEVCSADGLRLTDDASEFLMMLANSNGMGCLRTVKLLIEFVGRIRDLNGKSITGRTLRNIYLQLHGEQGRPVIDEMLDRAERIAPPPAHARKRA